MLLKVHGGSFCGHNGKTEGNQFACYQRKSRLVFVFDTDKDFPFEGHGVVCRSLGFCIGTSKVFIDSHHFPGGFHFRSEQCVNTGETVKGENRFLDSKVRQFNFR